MQLLNVTRGCVVRRLLHKHVLRPVVVVGGSTYSAKKPRLIAENVNELTAGRRASCRTYQRSQDSIFFHKGRRALVDAARHGLFEHAELLEQVRAGRSCARGKADRNNKEKSDD
ncbi:hypothetical protein V4C53_23275 [Paraburkholderia azotifigens]|uniref:hypothetical protein n=1 Tax=Paraburkholderia azotifigens TaxID=2057004 RepID=UPI00317C256B